MSGFGSWNQSFGYERDHRRMDDPPIDRFVYVDCSGTRKGLNGILSMRPDLERLRKQKHVASPLFAVISALGLALRHFRLFRFAYKNPYSERRHLEDAVNRGMEDFGRFEMNGRIKSAKDCFRSELNLLLSCAFWTIFGNSIQYEFGYRWLNQTQYDLKFQSDYLEVLGVDAFRVSPAEFQREADAACIMPSRLVADHAISENPETVRAQTLDELASAILAGTDLPGDRLYAKPALVEHPIARTVTYGKVMGLDLSLDTLGVALSGKELAKLIPARGPYKQYIPTTDAYSRYVVWWGNRLGVVTETGYSSQQKQSSKLGLFQSIGQFHTPASETDFRERASRPPDLLFKEDRNIPSPELQDAQTRKFSFECRVEASGSVVTSFSLEI